VLDVLADGLRYSAYFSDYFTLRRLSKLTTILALDTYHQFVIDLTTSSPVQVLSATGKLTDRKDRRMSLVWAVEIRGCLSFERTLVL
jgi:hypothetical protein